MSALSSFDCRLCAYTNTLERKHINCATNGPLSAKLEGGSFCCKYKASFKCLPYQLSIVGNTPTMAS